ncbi:MAG: HEPN domain-containing protein [Thermoplasmata archaeon]
MINEKEYRGYWWLPEDPDNKVGGILNFSPKKRKINLQIFSALKPKKKNFNPSIILGQTIQGKNITLRNCVKGSFSMKFGDYVAMPVEYRASEIFAGEHFYDVEIEIEKIRAGFPLLQKWSQITGVKHLTDFFEQHTMNSDSKDTFDLCYEIPESIEVELSDIIFELKIKPNTNLKRIGEVSIEEKAFIEISSKEGSISFNDLIQKIYVFQDFLKLATNKNLHPSWIQGSINQSSKSKLNWIKIYFPFTSDLNIPDRLHPNNVNFMFKDISDRFSSVISRWYEKAIELRPLFTSYFEIGHNENLYQRNFFLTLVQAIESYYRSEYDNKYLPDDKFEEGYYDQLCKNIPEKLSGGFKDHLKKGPFLHANEYSLRKKLSKILEEHESIFSSLDKKISPEIKYIVGTRNYLIHHDESTKNVAMDRLPEFIEILELIIQVILLRKIIRLSKDQIINRLNRQIDSRIIFTNND